MRDNSSTGAGSSEQQHGYLSIHYCSALVRTFVKTLKAGVLRLVDFRVCRPRPPWSNFKTVLILQLRRLNLFGFDSCPLTGIGHLVRRGQQL